MAATLKLVLLLSVFLYADFCKGSDLVVGQTNGVIAYTENVYLSAIPFAVRTKIVFFNGNRTIRGISAIDFDKGNSRATVTSGGPGLMFANVRLKSRRWESLNYTVQIFV